MPQPQLLIAEPTGFDASALQVLGKTFDVHLNTGSGFDWTQALKDYDAVWVRLGQSLHADDLPKQPRCKVIVCPATGLDHLDEPACASAGIEILSLRGRREFLRRIRGTSELALGLLLACLRKTVDAHVHVTEGGWDRDAFVGREIYGNHGLIIGHGRLGSIMAGYLEAMGATVSVYDPSPKVTVPPHRLRHPSLEIGVRNADFASIHVDLTASSTNLIDEKVLGQVRPHLTLINTSRGAVVDESAVMRALSAGALGAYGTDVVHGEADKSESPILKYLAEGGARVLITPHIGGKTLESISKTELHMAEELIKWQVKE